MTQSLLDRRPDDPQPMRFTERDGYILEAIHAFDGMLSDFQVMRLLFNPHTGLRQARHRLGLLWQHGYVARPSRRRRASLPCMVYWLDEKGAEYVASLSGQDLREFSWRKPGSRWSLIEHDLIVNDFRIAVMEACGANPELVLEEWIPSSEFWAYPDAVEYDDGSGKKLTRRVRPDAYFVIRGREYRMRLLLELDRGTEDNPRFVRDKVRPGLAYLRSKGYENRFGARSGRILVVTNGNRRMANMKRQAEVAAGDDAKVFYFTTLEAVKPETVLTAPIWYRGGDESPIPLFS